MLTELNFFADIFMRLLAGVPLTIQLAATAICVGGILGMCLVFMRISGRYLPDLIARGYISIFRGTPLLVQIYLIYYGLSQFPEVRSSFLWPFLRQPWWCAVLALSLNTAAYVAEIVRGSIITVAKGQIEAALAYGMKTSLIYRRIILPQAFVRMLPAYGNEIILMIKATSLASTITIMEVTGIAAQTISETYRPIEVFAVAGMIYLFLNFSAVFVIRQAEQRLSLKNSFDRNVQNARDYF